MMDPLVYRESSPLARRQPATAVLISADSEPPPSAAQPASAAEPTSSAPPPVAGSGIKPLRAARREAVKEFERQYLARLVQETGGDIRRSTGIAEVTRQLLQRLLRKHGM